MQQLQYITDELISITLRSSPNLKATYVFSDLNDVVESEDVVVLVLNTSTGDSSLLLRLQWKCIYVSWEKIA